MRFARPQDKFRAGKKGSSEAADPLANKHRKLKKNGSDPADDRRRLELSKRCVNRAVMTPTTASFLTHGPPPVVVPDDIAMKSRLKGGSGSDRSSSNGVSII